MTYPQQPYPPQQYPPGYEQGYPPQYPQGYPQPRRAGGNLIAIGILALMFGLFGLLCGTLSNGGEVFNATQYETLAAAPVVAGIISVLGLLAALLQLIGGVGSFFAKGWARGLLLTYALLAALLTIGWVGYTFWAVEEMVVVQNQAAQDAADQFGFALPEDSEATPTSLRATQSVFGVLKLVWPTVLLIWLNVPAVRRAYRGEAAPQPQYAYGYPPMQEQTQPSPQAPQPPSDYYGPPS